MSGLVLFHHSIANQYNSETTCPGITISYVTCGKCRRILLLLNLHRIKEHQISRARKGLYKEHLGDAGVCKSIERDKSAVYKKLSYTPNHKNYTQTKKPIISYLKVEKKKKQNAKRACQWIKTLLNIYVCSSTWTPPKWQFPITIITAKPLLQIHVHKQLHDKANPLHELSPTHPRFCLLRSRIRAFRRQLDFDSLLL